MKDIHRGLKRLQEEPRKNAKVQEIQQLLDPLLNLKKTKL
jgi:hypothetical protein